MGKKPERPEPPNVEARRSRREQARLLLAQDIYVRRVQQLRLHDLEPDTEVRDGKVVDLLNEEASDAFLAADAFLNCAEAWGEGGQA